nr:enoyl-CoA hydratase-related protein [Devosia subaequoris]
MRFSKNANRPIRANSVSSLVTLETAKGVAYVTLNRPDKLNAITIALRDELLDVLGRVGADADIGCVVLRGAGRAFCTGQDLAERAPILAGTAIDLGVALEEGINRIILELATLPQPTIACVQGLAVGAGASLAVACDIVLASHDASFHFSFSRLGLVPDSGASWLLPRKIGLARATSTFLEAVPINALQALDWGLVHQTAQQTEDLNVIACETAQKLAGRSRDVMAATKSLLSASLDSDLETQLKREAAAQTRAGQGAAYRAALRSFIDRSS